MFAALLFLAPWAMAQEGDAQPDSESNRIDQILRQMSDFLASTQSFGFTAHELIDGAAFFEENYFTNGMLTLVDRAFRHLAGSGAGSSPASSKT